MDHTEAINKQAVEKYFLGELKGAERDAFEEHFFDCAECAADVKTTAVLVDNVREVLRPAPAEVKKSPAREPRTQGFLTWWKPAYSFGAIAVLIAAIGYQNAVTIPNLRQATEVQEFQSFPVSNDRRGEVEGSINSQGQAVTEILVPAHRAFGMSFIVPPKYEQVKDSAQPEKTNLVAVKYGSYAAQIANKSGAIKVSFPITAEKAKNQVQLLIPGEVLKPDSYDLVILGYQENSDKPQEIIRHPFILRTK